MAHAHRLDEGPLLRAAGGREDLGADVVGDLDRGESDPARGGVDQHALALPQASEVIESVVSGQVDDGQGRRLLHRQAGRSPSDQASVGDGMARQAVDCHGQHVVARLQVLHAVAHGRHLAGALDPQGSDALGVAGVDTEGRHHVHEVETRGLDPDLDLAGGGRSSHDLAQAETIEDSRRRRAGKERATGGGRAARSCRWRAPRPQSSHEAVGPAQADLVLVAAGLELRDEETDLDVVGVAREVHERAVELRVLARGDPPESPERRLLDRRDLAGTDDLRAGADEPQPRRWTVRARRQRLYEARRTIAGERPPRLEGIRSARLRRRRVEAAQVDDPSQPLRSCLRGEQRGQSRRVQSVIRLADPDGVAGAPQRLREPRPQPAPIGQDEPGAGVGGSSEALGSSLEHPGHLVESVGGQALGPRLQGDELESLDFDEDPAGVVGERDVGTESILGSLRRRRERACPEHGRRLGRRGEPAEPAQARGNPGAAGRVRGERGDPELECGVEQGGVHAMPRGRQTVRQGQASPHGVRGLGQLEQRTKRGPVFESPRGHRAEVLVGGSERGRWQLDRCLGLRLAPAGAPAGVQRPLRRLGRPARDPDLPRLSRSRRQGHLDAQRTRRRQHERLLDLQLFEREGRGGAEITDGGESHLTEGRRGEHDRSVDAVVGEVGHATDADLRLPEVSRLDRGREVRSEQSTDRGLRRARPRGLVPVPLALPRVGRQGHDSARAARA